MGGTDDTTPASSLERLFVPADADAHAATEAVGARITPWVLDLIRRNRTAGASVRVCAHLAEDPDQGSVWLSAIPDLRSCRRPECTSAVLALREERLGRAPEDEPARCTTCGRTGVAVRGVGVAVGPAMLRGTVCDDCFAAEPAPVPGTATGPASAAPRGGRRPLQDDAAPLDVDLQELAGTERRPSTEAVGRRALRRGWLLAEACCRATAPGLDADRAVVGGLLVRAAKLAKGLAGPTPAEGAFAHDLAFRSLVGTTTALWWLLRADDAPAATAAFRDRGAADQEAIAVRERLRALGREADHDALLGPAGDAGPGSWRELRAHHLAELPGGFALELQTRDADPLRALIAGEHLSLACADYADRMPTDLDRDELRRLAAEVTELRADVEAALAEEAFPARSPASTGSDGPAT